MMRSGLSMLGGWDPSWIRIILTPARSCSISVEICWITHSNYTKDASYWLQCDFPSHPEPSTVKFSPAPSHRTSISRTCNCLMVSPPLPMMRPALPAGIIISCMEPGCPLGDSWPLETMSSISALARLKITSNEGEVTIECAQCSHQTALVHWEHLLTVWHLVARWEKLFFLEGQQCLRTNAKIFIYLIAAIKPFNIQIRQNNRELTVRKLDLATRFLLYFVDLFATSTDDFKETNRDV